MAQQTVVQLFHQALMNAFWIALPLLGAVLLVGIAIGVLQIVTSLQDASVGSIPRLAAVLFAFLFLLPWMLMRMTEYTRTLLGDFTPYVR